MQTTKKLGKRWLLWALLLGAAAVGVTGAGTLGCGSDGPGGGGGQGGGSGTSGSGGHAGSSGGSAGGSGSSGSGGISGSGGTGGTGGAPMCNGMATTCTDPYLCAHCSVFTCTAHTGSDCCSMFVTSDGQTFPCTSCNFCMDAFNQAFLHCGCM